MGRRCAADFIPPPAPGARRVPPVPRDRGDGCDNDSIHHARKVIAYLDEHPRLELLNGAGCSPHDNPAERTDLGRAEKLIYVANAAVDQPGRLRQIHSFFCNRSPDQMLDTAAPWTKPLTLRVTSRTSGMLHS